MANSKKPEPHRLAARTDSLLKDRIKPGERLAVGLSGGLDSVVLLHVLVQLRSQLEIVLSAVHVNHQISSRAQDWSDFCHHLCHACAVPCHIERVNVPRDTGLGLEAAARRARYEVYRRQPVNFVALAHHLDDQAETVLLQLLRGAGVRGLAAMPVMRGMKAEGEGMKAGDTAHPSSLAYRPSPFTLHSSPRTASPIILRPFIAVPRAVLHAYAAAWGLHWIKDESNQMTRFDRNFLRHEILPKLERRFPAYRSTFARSSAHCAEAAELLDEIAAFDLADALEGEDLDAARLSRLSVARAKNLLRYYFAYRGAPVPDSKQLEAMLSQALGARTDAQIEVKWANHVLRRHADLLSVERVSIEQIQTAPIEWKGESALTLPGIRGKISFKLAIGNGIAAEPLQRARVTLRCRRGGEKFRVARNRPRRTLKNLLREAGIPHWQRARMPLLFCGQTLVWVPGIGIDCDSQAKPGEPSVVVEWHFRSA